MENKTGWICPVCGKGLAPWMSYCDCVNHKSSNININYQYIDGSFAKTEQTMIELNKTTKQITLIDYLWNEKLT